jgi:hypothetical protein
MNRPGSHRGWRCRGSGFALLAVALLAACSSGSVTTGSPAATGSPATTGSRDPGSVTGDATVASPVMYQDCPSSPPPVTAWAGTDLPTAVFRCFSELEHVAGDGEWQVNVKSRATAGLAALVATLRLPSLPPVSGQSCTANLVLPVQVLLEVGGRTLMVKAPTDSCGQSRSEFLTAYGALTFVEVSRRRVNRVRTEAAVVGNCDRWKDMLDIEADRGLTGGPGKLLDGARPLHVCRFRPAPAVRDRAGPCPLCLRRVGRLPAGARG